MWKKHALAQDGSYGLYHPLKLSVTDDGLTAETGLTIKKFYFGIGSSVTLHALINQIGKKDLTENITTQELRNCDEKGK